MTRFVLTLLVAMLLVPAVAEEPLRIRVLTYNIHHAEGTDDKLDLKRIARIIADAKPDLVALQEVDYTNDRTGRVDQAAELARLTGLTAVPGDNIDYRGGRYGNAALSRWPIAQSKNHLLPSTGAERRGVLAVEIKPGEGRPALRFLCTHFDHRAGDDAERLASATFINELALESDAPAILAGDINAVPDSAVLKRLETVWRNPTADEPLPTIPAAKPKRQIDYVLARSADSWKLIDATVLDESVASDHRPLLVVLEWSGQEQ
ncbi:MAG: endonuclease/exonuclease/phosphatase family protein [Planctomycetaceae bacterium]